LPDLGVYNLATLTGLLGPARSVMAMTSIVTPTRKTDNKGEIKVEAEDNAMVLIWRQWIKKNRYGMCLIRESMFGSKAPR